jgi:hypothetical protein
MPERRMPNVVRQSGRVDEIRVRTELICATSSECVSLVRGTPVTSAPSPGPTT